MPIMEPGGPDLNQQEVKLFEAAQLAQRLVAGLLGFHAALTLLEDDRVLALIPPKNPGDIVVEGLLPHLGCDKGHAYHFTNYLDQIRSEPNRTLIHRLWASNALIRFGEALKQHGYFNRNPCLEMIRHLRNAVAHGERFEIRDPQKLAKYPAFLTAGLCHWEITPALDGKPLYDVVSMGDIASVIQHAGIHLNNMALERHVQR